ncbi:MAG: TatD family hydrolase [Chitinophagales bacterium]|nr:TatD family hydrolase [Chitinophagales bacterium]MDW8419757.1 TatD family hydrolase [Chitinophagales bacterium]
MLIDTHCHLYHKQFDADMKAVLQRAASAGIKRVYLPAIDTESHERMLELAEKSGVLGITLHPMMGVHPCSVNENYELELAAAEKYLKEHSFCAIGEIGLDFYWDVTYRRQQIEVFERQINLAVEYKLPIVIHSRNSTDACLECVKPYAGKVTGIFHCFSGSYEQAVKVIDLGFYIGIGGVLTYKNSTLGDIIRQTGLSHVVLETDAPYLAPVPYRGKRNEPGYVRCVAEHLANVMNMTTEEVAEITTQNALRIYGE